MEHLFFYGTLMAPFHRRQAADPYLHRIGRGWIEAALYDLGAYPAAIPGPTGRVVGEVCETSNPRVVLAALDTIEGYVADQPEQSLYRRVVAPVTLEAGGVVDAWVYFYNASVDGAPRIVSGDYLAHLALAR